MKSLSEYIQNSLSHQEIIEQINLCLIRLASADEFPSIHQQYLFSTPGARANVDFFLQKGLKNLGYPEKTVIEVCNTISSNNIGKYYKTFSKLTKLGKFTDKFILIYINSEFSAIPSFIGIDSNFEIMNLMKFYDICKKAELSENYDTLQAEKKESPATGIKVTPTTKPATKAVDWKEQREALLEELKEYIETDLVTLFLGAGVSASANMPDWGKLLEGLLMGHFDEESPTYFPCDLTNILHACRDSYIIAARYINRLITEKDKRANILQQLLYSNSPKSSSLIETICILIKEKGIYQAITTNYDQLLEQQLKKIDGNPYPVTRNGIIPKGKFPVYHVHGSVNDRNNPVLEGVPDAPVLSEEDYHTLYATGHHWSNTTILHAFHHTHCIFIGMSMTDPNLRRLLETNHSGDSSHYVFMARERLYEGYYEDDIRNQRHYQIQEEIMAELGVKIIWYSIDKDNPNPHHELEVLILSLFRNQQTDNGSKNLSIN